MVRFRDPVLPKEHGAWAVLLVPLAVSAIIAERVTLDFLLLTASALSFFLAYEPVQLLLRGRSGVPRNRFWAGAYFVAGLVFGVPLLVLGFHLLVPVAALAVGCFLLSVNLARGRRKSAGADFWAVVGLTLGGPSASYVLNGSISVDAVLVWIFHVLFFGSGVIYVHMKLRAAGLKNVHLDLRQRIGLGAFNLAYHGFVLAAVSVLVVKQYTPLLAVAAFVPVTVHAIMGTLRLSPTVRFRRLGFILLAHSILFGVLIGSIY